MVDPVQSAPRQRKRRKRGQALIEYTLLLAFVALACIGIMQNTGHSAQGIWSSANSQLGAADSSLSPTPKPSGDGHHHDGGDGGNGGFGFH